MKKVILAALAFAPALAFAQNLGGITTLVTSIGNIVEMAIPIVFGIIVLAFFWGLAKFVFSAGDEEARKSAKSMMIYSVVAMFLAASIWGITKWIGDIFGVDGITSVDAPNVSND